MGDEREIKNLVASALSELASVTSEMAFALSDFEPKYVNVYRSHIRSALPRLRRAEELMLKAEIRASDLDRPVTDPTDGGGS